MTRSTHFDSEAHAPSRRIYVAGLDLGQAKDPSALLIDRLDVTQRPMRHQIVHLHRWPLQTPYTQIVRDVRDQLSHSTLLRGDVHLVVDYTGVGRPVCDMLDEAGLRPIRISITSGHSVTQEGRTYRVAKLELVMPLVAAIQGRLVAIARDLPHRALLVDELTNFQLRTSASGAETAEALREGDNDDTVLAACCAVWYAERRLRPADWMLYDDDETGDRPPLKWRDPLSRGALRFLGSVGDLPDRGVN